MAPGVRQMAFRCLCITMAALLLLHALVRRHELLFSASKRRVAAAESRLRRSKHELWLQQAAAIRPRLAIQLEIGKRAEAASLLRLRKLTRHVEERRRRYFEARRPTMVNTVASSSSTWHALGPEGKCPAEVPDWDWQLLLRAAEARTDAPARETALAELAARSRLGLGELGDLSRRYEAVLSSPEFEGILDSEHPECTGVRFASLEGDRVLRIECTDPEGAKYALDDDSTLHAYSVPVRCRVGAHALVDVHAQTACRTRGHGQVHPLAQVRIRDAESVIAFCGDEYNLLSHPRYRPELLERSQQTGSAAYGERRPSVLVFNGTR